MRRSLRLGIAAAATSGTALSLLVAAGSGVPAVAAAGPRAVQHRPHARVTEAGGKLAPGKLLPHASAGSETAYDEARGRQAGQSAAASADLPPSTVASLGCANRGSATNIRVNQDCGARRQAEEQVAVNPRDPNNIIAGQNDSRLGYNHCGFDYSLDGGRHWGDDVPPFFGHLNASGQVYDAASDPTVTFNNDRAWYSCILFDINNNASGLFVSPSTPLLKGSAYNAVLGAYDADTQAFGSPYIVAEANNPQVFYDKQFIAGNPNSYDVYVTFTKFLFNDDPAICPQGYCSSAIYASHWDGATWSDPKEISGKSTQYCVGADQLDTRADPNQCNFDQGSFPVVLPNGNVYVVFNNGNTPSTVNQQLGRMLDRTGTPVGPIVKVGVDDESKIATCDFGRGPEECVKQLNVRTNDFPALAVDRRNPAHLSAVWQDSKLSAAGQGSYDVVISESYDGGMTWTDLNGGARRVPAVSGGANFEPSVTITPGGKVAVSYYRANITTSTTGMGTYGYGMNVRVPNHYLGSYIPVSDSQSLPSPQGNAQQAGFLGDYSSIASAWTSETVYPLWADTRNVSTTYGPDEDIFIKPILLQ